MFQRKITVREAKDVRLLFLLIVLLCVLAYTIKSASGPVTLSDDIFYTIIFCIAFFVAGWANAKVRKGAKS